MDEPTKSLADIQQEIGVWANMNFGHNVSKDPLSVSYGHPLGSLPSLLGVMEELGELARVVARRHQARGYKDAVEAQDAKEDAVADLLVFLCDFCYREGINLQPVLNRVWAKVCKRRQATWAEDKARESLAEQVYQARPFPEGGWAPGAHQDGHGFGHNDEGEANKGG
jgi:NTP pyrophosphatase (non-canonical NTP hydrolase)